MEYEKEYVRAAMNALDCQQASNLAGLLSGLERARNALLTRRRDLNKGTDWLNTHPVMYLFSVQMGYLTGSSIIADGDYSRNVSICEKIAAGEEVEGY